MQDLSKKFEQLVHYILWYCKDNHEHNHPHFGILKLNKIIWLLDVYQYCHTGHSMSGEEYYVKREHGPVPCHILAAIEDLATDNKLEVKGYTKKMRIDIDAADISKPDNLEFLDAEELKLAKKFCDKLAPVSGMELSDYSHDTVYDSYDPGEKIPLAAYLVSEQIAPTKEDISWAEKHLAV